MKMIICEYVNKGFEDLFEVGKAYPVLETAPNGRAWTIQRQPNETPTFVSVSNSVFGAFREIYDDR